MKSVILSFTLLLLWPVHALANGNDDWHMGGWGMMMGVGMLAWVVILVVIVVAVYLVVRLVQGPTSQGPSRETHQESAMDILKRRYARGEISKDEFDQMKRDLQG